MTTVTLTGHQILAANAALHALYPTTPDGRPVAPETPGARPAPRAAYAVVKTSRAIAAAARDVTAAQVSAVGDVAPDTKVADLTEEQRRAFYGVLDESTEVRVHSLPIEALVTASGDPLLDLSQTAALLGVLVDDEDEGDPEAGRDDGADPAAAEAPQTASKGRRRTRSVPTT